MSPRLTHAVLCLTCSALCLRPVEGFPRAWAIVAVIALGIAPGAALLAFLRPRVLRRRTAACFGASIAISPLVCALLVAPWLFCASPSALPWRLTAAPIALAHLWLAVRSRRSPIPAGRPNERWLIAAFALVAVELFIWNRPGSSLWLGPHGLLHAAVSESIGRAGLPVAHPFLADAPFGYYWLHHLQQLLIARAAGADLLSVFAAHNALSAAFCGLVALELARRLSPGTGTARTRRRGVLLLFILLGLNSVGPLLVRAALYLDIDLPLVPGLWRSLVAGYDPRTASTLDNLSASGSRWFSESSGWLAVWCASLRTRRRSAGALSATLALIAFLENPIVGAALWACTLALSLVQRTGRGVLAHVGGAVVAASYFFFTCRGEGHENVVKLALNPWWNVAGPHLYCVLVVLVGVLAGARILPAGGRWPLVLIPLFLLLGFSFGVDLPLDDQYLFVRLLSVPMALLAGKSLFDLARACSTRFSRRAVLFLGLLLLLPAPLYVGTHTWMMSRRPSPVEPQGDHLGWRAGTVEAWLLSSLRRESLDSDVVVCDPELEFPGLDKAQGSPIPGISGRRLYTEVSTNYLSRPARIRDARLDRVRALFKGQKLTELDLKDLAGVSGRILVLAASEYTALNVTAAVPSARFRTLSDGPVLVLLLMELR